MFSAGDHVSFTIRGQIVSTFRGQTIIRPHNSYHDLTLSYIPDDAQGIHAPLSSGDLLIDGDGDMFRYLPDHAEATSTHPYKLVRTVTDLPLEWYTACSITEPYTVIPARLLDGDSD
jgi:hypothetical protein